ncbi:Peptidase M76, ATP23 [Cordyceps fumosorosea ARSEF 2679]|uniref:Mitochondrial inner membrane protease ATP23 n=1 Tax=Cordyceps fumosorosea (strain ARSEF 2679) TaxID=1081104 RepID=A0A162N1U4_CORFA|nr:Peptidase M76, ATP23 [Cordyceps fumosorosea ARSEF 2679]OAA74139.1 Peptidase M76, ATP23 [Cordyceps fumosorosea ARSEF 2679]
MPHPPDAAGIGAAAADAAAAPAAGAATAAKQVVNDPARTGFDPQTKWWMNYFRILSGQMTPEGQFHYREWRYRVHEERDCKRCEQHRDWLFAYSPVVRFLRDKVADLNGRLDAANIVCRRCPARLEVDDKAADGLAVHRQSGGFSPGHGILICANEIRDRKHLEDTLAHEMVHAWDHLRWNVDWMGDKDLKHAACTEIRASMLSGECRWTREAFTRGNWTLTQQFQNCVRRRAIQSVMARPRCKDDVQATQVVNQVWDSCFSDTRPFDEVYR